MKDYKTATIFPHPPARVFECLRHPANFISSLLVGAQQFDYQVPDRLELGSKLQARAVPFGMTIEFVFDVVELVDGQRLVLAQTKGPFRSWRHQFQLFEESGDSTRLEESVAFEKPSGMLGLLVSDARILEALSQNLPLSHAKLAEIIAKTL